MKYCARCNRRHSGLCGIPPAASNPSASSGAQQGRSPTPMRSERRQEPQRAPEPGRPSGKALNDLLRWSLQEQRRLEAALKQPPEKVAGYDAMLEEYDRLREVVRQLRVQQVTGRPDAATGSSNRDRRAA